MTGVILSAKCLNWPEFAPIRDAFSRETTRSAVGERIFHKMSQKFSMTQQKAGIDARASDTHAL